MPSHWTYTEFEPDTDLCQGDIIRRTPELLSLLKKVHNHFCHEKYTAFMVLTQTCDLVRRGGDVCSARHITLCVVRELDHVLPNLLTDICGTEIPGVYKKEDKFLAEQLITRIVNQNEQARGLFYLHPDADAGIATPSVALLRISIAMRRQHYGVFLKSRSGRVSPEFSAKLGWLTGNLFSRVATPDWDEKETDNSAKKLANELLLSVSEADNRNWIPSAWIKAAQVAKTDLSNLDPHTAFDELKVHAPAKPIDVLTSRINSVCREVLFGELAPKLRSLLANNDRLVGIVIDNALQDMSDILAKTNNDLVAELRTDTDVRENIANQVQAIFKRAVRENPEDAVDSACNLLLRQKGLINPATTAVENVLNRKGLDTPSIRLIIERLQATNVYNTEAVKIISDAANTLFSDEIFDPFKKVIGRIRNDNQVKMALRTKTS